MELGKLLYLKNVGLKSRLVAGYCKIYYGLIYYGENCDMV